MKHFRIAMVAACPFPAAFASSGLIRELSLALAERGHSVTVITYHLGNNSYSTENLKIERIPHLPFYNKFSSGISPGKPLLDLLLYRKLLNVCRKNQFDVIHAHNYEAPPAAYFVRKKLGIPVVYHAHNTMYHELPSYFKMKPVKIFARRFGEFLDDIIPYRADHVITVSDDQYSYLLGKGVNQEKMTTIVPSINPGSFAGGNRQLIRQKLGLTSEPVIIYTGGLQPYQNCQILIPVLRECLAEVSDLHLIILARSTPSWLKDLAISAGVFDRIHFLSGHGMQFEADCLAAADIGIIPRSHCIGFPIKLLNYCSASLPVVCFEGLNKGFRNNTEVISVPINDVTAMSRAIISMIHNPSIRKELVVNSRKNLFGNHLWDQGLSKLEKIYSNLCDSSLT